MSLRVLNYVYYRLKMCYNIFMRFQAYFTPVLKVLLYIMAVLSLIGTIIGILVIAGVQIEMPQHRAITLLSICPLCAIIALLFATLHYKVEKHFLRLNLGFIDILGGRIRIDKILNIVIESKTMYISYLHKDGQDPVIAAIVISPKRFAEMKDLLISLNPNIVFYEEKDEPADSEQ